MDTDSALFGVTFQQGYFCKHECDKWYVAFLACHIHVTTAVVQQKSVNKGWSADLCGATRKSACGKLAIVEHLLVRWFQSELKSAHFELAGIRQVCLHIGLIIRFEMFSINLKLCQSRWVLNKAILQHMWPGSVQCTFIICMVCWALLRDVRPTATLASMCHSRLVLIKNCRQL